MIFLARNGEIGEEEIKLKKGNSMNHDSAREIIRLDRLERAAEIYHKLGMLRGNLARAQRATRLWYAAYNRSMGYVSAEVSSYAP